tara:strand:+ start:173 stop:370 length:198 start_codon:yes stop_codon:yes gene_type:complete
MFSHPKNVCMTYTEHFKFSLYLSYTFAKASVCALVHALHPDMFVTHSSDTIAKITEEMKKVGCRD